MTYIFALPNVDNLIMQLGSNTHYSSIDLSKMFHQIECDAASRKYLNFNCPQGTYTYTVLPFGLKNAPSYASKMISDCLGDLHGRAAMNFLDDIIILGTSDVDHLQHIDAILDRLNKFQLKINLRKTNFFKKYIRYLGFYLGNGECIKDPEKVKSINEFPRPNSCKSILSFLGMAAFYSRFINKFGTVAAPLYELSSKGDKQFQWDAIHESAFVEIKKLMVSANVLALPQFDKPFYIASDASKVGLGACLMQTHTMDNGVVGLKVVSYWSRKMKSTELKWHIYEQEMLALSCGVEKFGSYFSNNANLVCYIDHYTLTFLKTQVNLSERSKKFLFFILSYPNISYVYIKGNYNLVSDCLSRTGYISSFDRIKDAIEGPENIQSDVHKVNMQLNAIKSTVTIGSSEDLRCSIETGIARCKILQPIFAKLKTKSTINNSNTQEFDNMFSLDDNNTLLFTDELGRKRIAVSSRDRKSITKIHMILVFK